MAESGSLTVYPGAYDASASSVYSMSGATKPVGKGSDNTTYAQFEYGTAFWSFDVSSVPLNADINSVSCDVKAYRTYTGAASPGSVSLCSGDVVKSSTASLGGTATVHTLTGGTWTREELSSVRLKFVMGGTTAYRYIRFYGADLTVTYTYQSEKFMLKLGGAWHDVARVFKKVSGIWVEQTDLANVIEDGVRYKNGGEYVAPKKTVTVKGTGNSSVVYVTINGTKYTSAASVQVSPGDVITATVGGTNPSDSSITADGTQVIFGKAGSYNYTVQSDCTVTLSYTNDDFFGTSGDITITTGGGSSANLISFTVDGTSYQAEEGMTWEQWCDSSYNKYGWEVGSNYVQDGDGGWLSYVDTDKTVKPTEAIVSGGSYYFD